MGTLLLAAYFVALVVLSGLRRNQLRGRAIFLFRAFFPSWRFFEDLGDVPALYARFGPSSQVLGEWQPCLGKIERRWSELFVNPRGNLRLSCGSLLQHLLSDLEDADEARPEEFANSVSYQLTRNLVESEIVRFGSGAISNYQFKVMAGSEEVILSPVYSR